LKKRRSTQFPRRTPSFEFSPATGGPFSQKKILLDRIEEDDIVPP
jgi:hypothetical protein